MSKSELELNPLERCLGPKSILHRALMYELNREDAGAEERAHKTDARILLYMIEDKPHLAIKYISELLSEKKTP